MLTSEALVIASLERSLAFLEAEYQHLQADIDAHINDYPALKQDRHLLQNHSRHWQRVVGAHGRLVAPWRAL